MTQTIEQLTARVRELTAENRIERNLRSSVEAAFDMLNEEIGRYKAAFEQQKAEVGRLSIAHVKACQANADSQAELAASQLHAEQLREALEKTNEGIKAELSDNWTCSSYHPKLFAGEKAIDEALSAIKESDGK